MEMLLWQKVLIGIYHEQIKLKPQMAKLLKGQNFGIKQSELVACLIHLHQNERYTSHVMGNMTRLTREGREYVERLCNIDISDDTNQKSNKLIKILSEQGLSFVSDIIAKVAGEYMRNGIK